MRLKLFWRRIVLGRQNMAAEPSSTYFAWWGACLSTLLAVVKLLELWQNRFRVEAGGYFTSNENIGNEVLVRNLSSHPIIITHWELIYCSGRWPHRKFESFESAEYDHGDYKLDPHATRSLIFSDANYFATSPEALKGRRIYIRLHFAGRKSMVKLLHA
ncbi:hypothetical protein [Xanthomonas translucens]|uniref:hypothetical protein n=1 Tax=Xanthomonas campestris pv. translucens TaxID=343 RepID=UPI000AF69BD2|nr:hypothetical protein [Xanthomonas translucens]MCT8318775.1 hypothetical protein [Xanthomonas translucens pv. undulosa]QSQ57194.1 hypothetical protein ISN37_04075 [Xanthomonas translucens pv. undulosa]UKE40785.1 hypothetical protein KCU58_05985 [Xanthomonas translucens pv. undulosa]WLA03791.1 hypothetical protein MO329_14120 [Xanthomonas translucens]